MDACLPNLVPCGNASVVLLYLLGALLYAEIELLLLRGETERPVSTFLLVTGTLVAGLEMCNCLPSSLSFPRLNITCTKRTTRCIGRSLLILTGRRDEQKARLGQTPTLHFQ